MSDESRLAIGRRITERRMKLELSQDELAERLAIKQSSVSVAELTGLSTLDAIRRWSIALDCSAMWLAYGKGKPEKENAS